jgi:hypothetical protein
VTEHVSMLQQLTSERTATGERPTGVAKANAAQGGAISHCQQQSAMWRKGSGEEGGLPGLTGNRRIRTKRASSPLDESPLREC